MLYLLCVFLLIAGTAAAELDLGSMTSEELIDLRNKISIELANRDAAAMTGEYLAEFQGDRGWLGLTGVEVFDHNGEMYLRLIFDYWNNTEKADNFASACWTKAYQSGTALEHPSYGDSGAPSILTEQQPGVQMQGFRTFYKLIDRSPTVQIVIYNGLNMRNPDEHTYEFELKYPD